LVDAAVALQIAGALTGKYLTIEEALDLVLIRLKDEKNSNSLPPIPCLISPEEERKRDAAAVDDYIKNPPPLVKAFQCGARFQRDKNGKAVLVDINGKPYKLQ
jgi:hypothetical protein